ncbi:hypothetical protein Hdeb2414_s0003g00102301 [Helianthus debilis subsp. tardiflorus]
MNAYGMPMLDRRCMFPLKGNTFTTSPRTYGTGETHTNITLLPEHDVRCFVEARKHTSLSKNVLGASVTLPINLWFFLLPLTHLQQDAVYPSSLLA